MLLLFSSLVLLLAAWYGIPLLHRGVQTLCVDRICRRSGLLSLTFDDGPGAALTANLLPLLERRGARATFFALGQNAVRHPELVERVRAAGHELGCHAFAHVDSWRAGPLAALSDIRAGFSALNAEGYTIALFRPPRGRLTLLGWTWLWWKGVRVVWWTLDSGDTAAELGSPEDVVRELLRRGGGVVLLHDFDRSEARMQYVLDLTERLLRAAEESGLRVVPVSRLVEGASR